MLNRMHTYPPGSIVQHRNGYIFVKLESGKWQGEQRWVMENKVMDRPLKTFERVYHKDGHRDNNKPDNLVVIRYNETTFELLKESRVLFIPKSAIREMRIAVS